MRMERPVQSFRPQSSPPAGQDERPSTAEDTIRGRQGVLLKSNRPENLRVYAEEQARVRIETTELLPTPEQSHARRRLRDRAGRVWRKLSAG